MAESTNREFQREYFQETDYPDPNHPRVLAYARPMLELVRRFAPMDGSTTVLDLGAGNGVFSARLVEITESVVATDLSGHMLASNPCQRKFVADASALPCADASFDIVFEANLLHHARAVIDPIVGEMKRVSRGLVAFIEPNMLNPLMWAYSRIDPVERDGRGFGVRFMGRVMERNGLEVLANFGAGMITQKNTPQFLIPILRYLHRPLWFGMYAVTVARKPRPPVP